MNEKQIEIYKELTKIIKSLSKEIEYSFGFGSFWQDFNNYGDNSDIDFIVIINSEPNFNKLQQFYENIEKINNKFNCKLSAQIFVGKYKNLFYSYENILRLLTIINKKNNVVELYNEKKYKFYEDITNLKIDILELSKYQIFNILRFYNRDFYKNIYNIDNYRYREVKFLFDAIYSHYKMHPKSKKAKYLMSKIKDYYENYNKYTNNKRFHDMLMDLYQIIIKGE